LRGHRVEQSAFVSVQHSEFGFANANRVFQHALEYRLKLAGRTADHLQHLGRRGLLL
jgi:hypothetical protein